MLSKLYPIRSHTGAAQGGISAALGNVEEDKAEWHAFDTVKGGDYLVDQQAAHILPPEEAIQAVYDLENRGLPFNRTPEGRIDQRRFGGHTRNFGEGPVRRACYAADRTGHMILQTLYQQCIKNSVRLLRRIPGGRSPPPLRRQYLQRRWWSSELANRRSQHIFVAKAVLFATGGFGRMFKITSNAYAQYRRRSGVLWPQAGIPLEDMEFFQFHPTGIMDPSVFSLPKRCAERGEFYATVTANSSWRVTRPTLGDLAPRDIVARAILT